MLARLQIASDACPHSRAQRRHADSACGGRSVGGETPGLRGRPSSRPRYCVSRTEKAAGGGRVFRIACGERGGDLLAVDRFDHVERLDRLARLVALQRADQVQFDASCRSPRRGRADPPISPSPPARGFRRTRSGRRRGSSATRRRPEKVLDDRDQRDILRPAAAIARAAAPSPRARSASRATVSPAMSIMARLRLTLRAPSPIEPQP